MKAETNRKDVYRKALCLLIPAVGLAFLLWYIKNATCDVVYSDYIRLVNSYLPDVYDPDRFFVPDVLTRIPINYLGRIINVELFGFSITFDRVLGAVSTALAAWVFGLYFIRHKLGSIWFFLIMAVTFSLNQWEMLIAPLSEQMDIDNTMPHHIAEKMAELGFMGINVPEEYGGAGMDEVSKALVIMEIAKVDASVAELLAVHTLTNDIFLKRGTEEQKKKYLALGASGKIGAFALTEPGAGSDASAAKTIAISDGDDYII